MLTLGGLKEQTNRATFSSRGIQRPGEERPSWSRVMSHQRTMKIRTLPFASPLFLQWGIPIGVELKMSQKFETPILKVQWDWGLVLSGGSLEEPGYLLWPVSAGAETPSSHLHISPGIAFIANSPLFLILSCLLVTLHQGKQDDLTISEYLTFTCRSPCHIG